MLAHFLSSSNRQEVSRMAYRRTENVIRRLAARHDAIIAAAGALASEAGINAVQIGPVAERATPTANAAQNAQASAACFTRGAPSGT